MKELRKKYELRFAGLAIDSIEFEQELERLAHELSPKDSPDLAELNVFAGTFEELQEQGYLTSTIKPQEIYEGEELIIIKEAGDKIFTEPLILRGITVDNKSEIGLENEIQKRIDLHFSEEEEQGERLFAAMFKRKTVLPLLRKSPPQTEIFRGTTEEIRLARTEFKNLIFEGVEPDSDEEVIFVRQTGEKSKPALVLKVKDLLPQKATYALPRYPGLTKEMIEDPNKFTDILFYSLYIAVERFKWQDQIFYRETIEEMEEQGRADKDFCTRDLIRPFFEKRHKDILPLPEEAQRKYESVTRLLRDMMFLRLHPDHTDKSEELFERISKPLEKLPEGTITSPNEVLDVVLRMLVVSIDTIILDHQRAAISKDDDEGEIRPKCAEKIEENFKEVQKLHESLSAKYDPSQSDERHWLPKDKAEGFHKMYGEISGEIFKTVMLCYGNNTDMRLAIGNKAFGDRIAKLGEAINETTYIGQAANRMIVGVSSFFRKACQFIAISESRDESRDFDRQRKSLRHEIKRLSKRLGKESEKIAEEEKTETEKLAIESVFEVDPKTRVVTAKFPSPADFEKAIMPDSAQETKLDEKTWLSKMSDALMGIYALIPDIARSKRSATSYTEELEFQVEEATVRVR